MRTSTPVMLGLEIWHNSHSWRGSSGPFINSARTMRHCCSVSPFFVEDGTKLRHQHLARLQHELGQVAVARWRRHGCLTH